VAEGEQKEKPITVLLALAANLGVAVAKLAAGLISGSPALLSEAAHSFGDSTTEVLLLVAVSRSDKPADRDHPFGYGKERYFWSLIAAVAIFISGAAFSIWEGLHTIFASSGAESDMLWINYPVLAIAAVLEGLSFRQAVRQVKGQMRRRRTTLLNLARTPEDPTVNSVAAEDSAALVGLAVAAIGVALHQITGSPVWDGVASLVIGLLLLVVAFVLARACERMLIGQQAPRMLLVEIEKWLEQQEEILDIVDILSMLVGTDRVLLCVRADFVDTYSAGQLEAACARVDRELRKQFKELDEIFVQPVSRSDVEIRDRVQRRYGRVLADS
jgi:cation diffusion facilitator family transporter